MESYMTPTEHGVMCEDYSSSINGLVVVRTSALTHATVAGFLLQVVETCLGQSVSGDVGPVNMWTQRSVFLISLIYGAWSQVNHLVTSPDVDTQSGFFPDSGPVLTINSEASVKTDNWLESPDNLSNDNKLLSLTEAVAFKPTRLQQMMSRITEEKAVKLEHKQSSVASTAEDTSYLLMFIGAKEAKTRGH